MSTETSPSAPPSTHLLCWCNAVTRSTYTEYVSANPGADPFAAAHACNIGTRCTSCLADIEAAYIETRGRGPGAGNGDRPQREMSLRQRFWRLIDRLSPLAHYRVSHLAPVLRSATAATTVTLANSQYSRLADMSASATVRMTVRNHEGRTRHVVSRHIEPGSRIDLVASDYLDAPSGDNLSIGTCLIDIQTTGEGVIGTMRPHFTVETPESASSVHTQGAGGALSGLFFALRGAARQSHFVAIMNCIGQSNPITLMVKDHSRNQIVHKSTITLAAHGAAFCRLPLAEVNPWASYSTIMASGANFKPYYGLDFQGRRYSLDHF